MTASGDPVRGGAIPLGDPSTSHTGAQGRREDLLEGKPTAHGIEQAVGQTADRAAGVAEQSHRRAGGVVGPATQGAVHRIEPVMQATADDVERLTDHSRTLGSDPNETSSRTRLAFQEHPRCPIAMHPRGCGDPPL